MDGFSGAGWKYIFFGMFHFTLILSGNIFEPLTKKITDILHINRQKLPFKIFQMIRTTFLVIIGELFFRAKGLKAGMEMFKNIITNFSFDFLNNGSILNLGMDKYDFIVVVITLLIIFITSVLKEKRKKNNFFGQSTEKIYCSVDSAFCCCFHCSSCACLRAAAFVRTG